MESVLPVSEHPYLYRQSQTIPAVREIVAHPNYIVYYRVTAICIEVVNVIHTRTDRRFNHMRPSIAPRMRPQSA